MRNLIFSFVFLFSSLSFAAPEKLMLGGESKLKKSNFIVTMDLKKEKESKKKVLYKGTMTVMNATEIKQMKVGITFYAKKSKVSGMAMIKGTIYDGEAYEMSGTADLNSLSLGSRFDLETKHMQYYMFPSEIDYPPHWETYRRTVLDKGVTTVEVME